jgi:hypothetical protein
MTENVTGVLTIAIAGVTVALTPADALAWGQTLMQLGPLALIMFLVWRLKQLDKDLGSCRESHDKVAQQLLLAFTAIKNPELAADLPHPSDIVNGNATLVQCPDGTCKVDQRH